MIKMIIEMIMISFTALKKPKLLYISSTQSTRTFKGNPFLSFQYEDFKAFKLLISNGTKSQIFGPKKNNDSVPW